MQKDRPHMWVGSSFADKEKLYKYEVYLEIKLSY